MTDRVDVGQTLELLDHARTHLSLVRIRRSIRGSDVLDGFVLAAGPEWLLLGELHNVELDGYDALRTADVERITFHVGRPPLEVRALEKFGSWPPRVPAYVELGSVRDVLDMAAAHAPIVHIELEHDDPDAAYIGRVAGYSETDVELRQISPDADWDDEPEAFPLAEITRVAFGGRYEHALHVLGGDPPR